MTIHRSPANFQLLLEVWNAHQNLRRDGAPIAELAASRQRLDTVRNAR